MKALALLPLLVGVAAAPTPRKPWFVKRFTAFGPQPQEQWSSWGAFPVISILAGVDEGMPCDASLALFKCGGPTYQLVQYCHEGRWLNVRNCRAPTSPGPTCLAPSNECTSDNWDSVLFRMGSEYDLISAGAPKMWDSTWWSDGTNYRRDGFPGNPMAVNPPTIKTAGVVPLNQALSAVGASVGFNLFGYGPLTTIEGGPDSATPTASVVTVTVMPTTPLSSETPTIPPPSDTPATTPPPWETPTTDFPPSESPTTDFPPWETPTTDFPPSETPTTDFPPSETPTELPPSDTEAVPQPSDTPATQPETAWPTPEDSFTPSEGPAETPETPSVVTQSEDQPAPEPDALGVAGGLPYYVASTSGNGNTWTPGETFSVPEGYSSTPGGNSDSNSFSSFQDFKRDVSHPMQRWSLDSRPPPPPEYQSKPKPLFDSGWTFDSAWRVGNQPVSAEPFVLYKKPQTAMVRHAPPLSVRPTVVLPTNVAGEDAATVYATATMGSLGPSTAAVLASTTSSSSTH